MKSRFLERPAIPLSAAVISAGAVAFGGCNSLLDNRPADLGGDLFATQPADAGASERGAVRDADASAPAPPGIDPTYDAAADPLPPQCLAGTKPCGDVCVSIADPYFGCGGPTCERCAPAHGSAACAGDQCAVGECAPGFADCNGVASDGCEVDLAAPASCGACGVTCVAAPNSSAACVAGACASQCQAGFDDCDHDQVDGCESSLLTDKRNCGQCGRVCIIGDCEAGKCVWKL